MARLLTTGFESGSIQELNGGSNAYATVQASYKRTGSYALQLDTGTSTLTTGYVTHTFSADKTEFYFRLALMVDSSQSNYSWDLLIFYDNTNATQLKLRYETGTQTLNLYRGDTLIASGSLVIRADVWTMIQGHIVVHDSTGVVVITHNNVTSLSFSGDTKETDVDGVRSFTFRASNAYSGEKGLGKVYIDDLAFNDTSGSYQNSWPGLGGVYLLMPNADGSDNDWTPSTGSDNYAMVDEQPRNTTDWVQALGTGNVDLYDHEDTPLYIETINLVEVVYQAAVIESGYNEIEDIIYQAGTAYYGGTTTITPIVNDYTLFKGTAHYVQPNAAGAWGTAEVNAAEFGFWIPG